MSKKLSIRLWFGFALGFALLAVALLFTHSDSALLFFPKGSPEDCADAFFAAIERGDSNVASAFCVPALPAENRPAEADAARVYDALRGSRHWQRQGVGQRKGNRATVSGTLTVLDPTALTGGMKEDVNAVLAELVAEARLGSDIYNEDGSYKNEVVMAAWDQALTVRLEHAVDYTVELPLTVHLLYQDGQWRVQTNEELMTALSGGIL